MVTLIHHADINVITNKTYYCLNGSLKHPDHTTLFRDAANAALVYMRTEQMMLYRVCLVGCPTFGLICWS
jgi:hypothetical protein